MFRARRLPTRVLHITDSEGSSVFFKTLKNNSVVHYHPDKGLYFNKKIPKPYFIFGGDVTDRGKHDREITKLLVDFKRREPHRVALLAGNREIKNNRFKIELDQDLIRARLLRTPSPRWLPENERTVPLDYVIADMSAKGRRVNTQDNSAITSHVNSLSIEECQLIYLRWMLEKTMGCPHTFRYRREEMAQSLQKTDISDVDVLRNFLQETAPDGLMGQYLQLAQVGVIVPDTCILAVHGGLTETNIGKLPEMSAQDKPITDVKLWIKLFNEWYAEQIKQWIHFKPTELTVPGCAKLDESALPLPGKNKTIITSDMLSKDRGFIDIPAIVRDYLIKNKIYVVLTGHQPSGDHPAILRNGNVIFINGDTGYAKFNPGNPDDTRGEAFHVLEITAAADEADIFIRAALADGTPSTTNLFTSKNKFCGDEYIGRILSDERLVQCKLSEDQYRLIYQNGRQVKYSTMQERELSTSFEYTASLCKK